MTAKKRYIPKAIPKVKEMKEKCDKLYQMTDSEVKALIKGIKR